MNRNGTCVTAIMKISAGSSGPAPPPPLGATHADVLGLPDLANPFGDRLFAGCRRRYQR